MEELKYIMENILPLVQAGAPWAIAYLLTHLILPYVVGLTALTIAYKLLRRFVEMIHNEHRLQELRDAAGVGCSGTYYDSEHRDLLMFIKRMRGS